MRNGYKLTLSVLTIMILITITVGTSYSYYLVSDVQSDTNTLASTCFNISFSDSDVISLNSDGVYAYPMSEASALSKLTPYEFTITNTCSTSADINYVVTLNTLTTTTSNLTSYLNYKLNQTSPSAVTGTTSALTTSVYTDLPDSVIADENISTSYSLASGTLSAGESKTYNLYLWIDEDAGNDIMGYTFTGKLLVYSYL